MKKLFSILTVGIVVMIAAVFPQQACAQRGEKTLGVAGGFATYNNGGYANLYFQYSVLNYLRIAPEIGYVFRNEGKSAFEMSVDVQFPFRLAKGFAVYPLAGVTFNNWSYRGGGHASRLGADFGGGFDIYLTSNLKLNLQGKYSMMNDTGGGFIDMGIGYVF
ncbi:MAG: hypothetical protein NC097_02865 [Clostridium sp.]|nr:hypothetical protein [Prevotella sp.]MCM1428717.1 hypothetical protein [Clostridium sp.]MCM1475092.1 hypothetical protein [Muribaculaceae bacterium]